MIRVSCHCGNVSLAFEQLPSSVRDCDCPVCNRLGALWADFEPNAVQVTTKDGPTASYRWDDGDYEMHHCKTCGCTTHYAAADKCQKSEFGINLRMLDREDLELIPITTRSG